LRRGGRTVALGFTNIHVRSRRSRCDGIGANAEVGVGPLNHAGFDHRFRRDDTALDHRCTDQALSVDLGEGDLPVASETHGRERNRDEFFADHSAGHNGGDDLAASRFDNDVFDSACFRSIRGFDDVLIFTNSEDGVFGSVRERWECCCRS